MYEELKKYFIKHLKKPTTEFRWTQRESDALFDFLETKYPNEMQKKDFIKTLEIVISEFFEPVGLTFLEVHGRSVALTLRPYTLEPSQSRFLDDIIDIIEVNEPLIEFDYKGNENQISIQKELKEKLFRFVYTSVDEPVNKKELVKFALREALELEESDIIIIRDEQIFIRLFDHSKKKEIPPSEQESIANRFNGIDETELELFYGDYFLVDENKEFFKLIAEIFVDRYFLAEQIDNLRYEKYVFTYIQAIIIEELEYMYDHNYEFFKGFSGFIFRKHFKDVFSHIADLMLLEIVSGNKYMIEFLKYYSLNVIIVSGVKYKVPELEAKDGLKWNVLSMLSIVKAYINSAQNIAELKEDLAEVEEEIDAMYIGEHSPVEYNELYLKEKQKLADLQEKLSQKLNRLHDIYESEKDERKRALYKEQVLETKEQMQLLRDKKAKFLAKAIKRETLIKFGNLEKEFENLKRKLQREKRLLAQNEESYSSIKSALVKALISKKQPL